MRIYYVVVGAHKYRNTNMGVYVSLLVLWTQFDSCTCRDLYTSLWVHLKFMILHVHHSNVVIPAAYLWLYLPIITYAFCLIFFHFSLFRCVASSVFPTPFFFCLLCCVLVCISLLLQSFVFCNSFFPLSLFLFFSMSHTFSHAFFSSSCAKERLNKQGTFNRTLFQYVTRVNWKWK